MVKLLLNEFIAIAKANKNSPLLRAINYNAANGLVGVTDRHRMLVAETAVPADLTISIDTGLPVSDHYPDFKRIMPTGTTTQFSVNPMSNWKMIKSWESQEVPFLEIDEGRVSFAGIEIAKADMVLNEKIHMNPKYFYEMLNFMYKVDKFSDNWTITIKDGISPIMVNNTNYHYVLTPVRTF